MTYAKASGFTNKPLICRLFLLTLQSKTVSRMENQDNLAQINNEAGNNSTDNEIILYQPDSTFTLDVRVERDTVWLNRNQMAILFDRDVKTIGKHIKNALHEELDGFPTVAKFATVQKEGDRIVTRTVEYYNLDVIISVGYRVKSNRGIQFRAWANKVLKDYLLRGYSVNQRLLYMESRIDHRLSEHDRRLNELTDRVDFFVRTSLPPKEGVLFDGQIFDAHVLVSNLVKQAKTRIVLIDNYVDESILTLLDKREAGVKATIYTDRLSDQLKLDIRRHNRQYEPIEVKESRRKIHDRFFIIDETLYHVGASIKDLGRKLFAFSEMEMSPDSILSLNSV